LFIHINIRVAQHQSKAQLSASALSHHSRTFIIHTAELIFSTAGCRT
jgi:hypothetical protein